MKKTPQAIGPAHTPWIQSDTHNSMLNLWTRHVRPMPVDSDISSQSHPADKASVVAWALTVSSQIKQWPKGKQEPLLGFTLDPLLLAEPCVPNWRGREKRWVTVAQGWSILVVTAEVSQGVSDTALHHLQQLTTVPPQIFYSIPQTALHQ